MNVVFVIGASTEPTKPAFVRLPPEDSTNTETIIDGTNGKALGAIMEATGFRPIISWPVCNQEPLTRNVINGDILTALQDADVLVVFTDGKNNFREILQSLDITIEKTFINVVVGEASGQKPFEINIPKDGNNFTLFCADQGFYVMGACGGPGEILKEVDFGGKILALVNISTDTEWDCLPFVPISEIEKLLRHKVPVPEAS